MLIRCDRCVAQLLAGVALAVTAAVAAGCAADPPTPSNPLAIDAREYDRVFDASLAELREAGFVLDRRDHRFGRISTEPLDVPVATELWKPTPAPPEFAGPATLGHLRRRATVMIDPAEPPGYDLRVEVVVERSQAPLRRLSGTAGRQVFATLSALPTEWEARGIEPRYWEPIGRDEALEAALLRAIIERSVRP